MVSNAFFRLRHAEGVDSRLRHLGPPHLPLGTGRPLPADFTPPLRLEVSPGLDRTRLASMYFDPAWIVRRDLWAAMAAHGPHAVEVHPAVIADPDSGAELADYVLVHVLATVAPPLGTAGGRPSAASGGNGAGGNGSSAPGNGSALDADALPHLFLLDDDRSSVVLRDHLAATLVGLGAHDIELEPVHLG